MFTSDGSDTGVAPASGQKRPRVAMDPSTAHSSSSSSPPPPGSIVPSLTPMLLTALQGGGAVADPRDPVRVVVLLEQAEKLYNIVEEELLAVLPEEVSVPESLKTKLLPKLLGELLATHQHHEINSRRVLLKLSRGEEAMEYRCFPYLMAYLLKKYGKLKDPGVVELVTVPRDIDTLVRTFGEKAAYGRRGLFDELFASLPQEWPLVSRYLDIMKGMLEAEKE